jgi:hypothetical protein
MRRYSVRFLVAILTFAIGVALSLVLGLFKPREIQIVQTWSRRPPCPKKFRLARPALLTVDSQPGDPLKFVYIGPTSSSSPDGNGRMLFAIENRSGRAISDYSISSNEIWETNETPPSNQSPEWGFYAPLEPGESRSLTLPENTEGLSLRIARINFQDGSIWVNPRPAK